MMQIVAAHFTPIAGALAENEATIIAELAALQGKAVDLGGYYNMDASKIRSRHARITNLSEDYWLNNHGVRRSRAPDFRFSS